jgi:hypothetical protein
VGLKNTPFSAIIRGFFSIFMSKKASPKMSLEELRMELQKMIEQSPTLQRFSEQKEAFLELLPQLNEVQLDALKSQLEAESEDWKTFLEDSEKERAQLTEQMEQESLQLLKSAEKQLLNTQETFSKADNAQAEALLSHFDD